MKLSRTVAYGVQATLQIAQNKSGQPVPCSTLAQEGRMPERFLLQILRDLVNHGILRSTRGVEGGYNLARKPDDISLAEIIEALEGPMQFAPSTPGSDALRIDVRLRQALDQITTTARRQLAAIKLSDLMTGPGKVSGGSSRSASS